MNYDNGHKDFEKKYRHLKNVDPFRQDDEYFEELAGKIRDEVRAFEKKKAPALIKVLIPVAVAALALLVILIQPGKTGKPLDLKPEIVRELLMNDADMLGIEENLVVEVYFRSLADPDSANGRRDTIRDRSSKPVIPDYDSLKKEITTEEIIEYLLDDQYLVL